jgi:uncharacterized protein YndB with AHSA1/START domain
MAGKTKTSKAKTPADSNRDLVLTRVYDAPREKVYKAFTDADILKQWFVPRPWTISEAKLDVRPGGVQQFTMRDPDGNEYPNAGVYLEVVPNERLVTTDAYIKAWEPSQKPFMTVILTFEDAGKGKTKYTADARHWTVEARKEHEQMGFHEGWGIVATQLEALAKTM